MSLRHATEALSLTNAVMVHGDDKYGEGVWKDNGKSDNENLQDHLAAIQRHLNRHLMGAPIDESGHLALAHVAARALMALHFVHKVTRFQKCGMYEDEQDLVCDLAAEHKSPQHFDMTEQKGWGS